jgi:hypothetical protein
VVLEADIPDLDYWEIDPAWDGKVFHSAAQAFRPRRAKEIARKIALPAGIPVGELCVRLVRTGGEQIQVVI